MSSEKEKLFICIPINGRSFAFFSLLQMHYSRTFILSIDIMFVDISTKTFEHWTQRFTLSDVDRTRGWEKKIECTVEEMEMGTQCEFNLMAVFFGSLQYALRAIIFIDQNYENRFKCTHSKRYHHKCYHRALNGVRTIVNLFRRTANEKYWSMRQRRWKVRHTLTQIIAPTGPSQLTILSIFSVYQTHTHTTKRNIETYFVNVYFFKLSKLILSILTSSRSKHDPFAECRKCARNCAEICPMRNVNTKK